VRLERAMPIWTSAYPGKVDTDIGFTRYRRIKSAIGNIRFAWFSAVTEVSAERLIGNGKVAF